MPECSKTLGNPRGCECVGTFPTTKPFLRPVREQVTAPASRWQPMRWPWAHTGGGPEAAVCLGGEHFRDALPPGALPRVGFPPWQTTDVGEGGERQAPLHIPTAIWAAGGGMAEPLRLPRAGTAIRLGWQPGWGLGTCPAQLLLTPPAGRSMNWDRAVRRGARRV